MFEGWSGKTTRRRGHMSRDLNTETEPDRQRLGEDNFRQREQLVQRPCGGKEKKESRFC